VVSKHHLPKLKLHRCLVAISLLRCPLESIELQRCCHITWVGLCYLSELNGSWMRHLELGHCYKVSEGGMVNKIPSIFPKLDLP